MSALIQTIKKSEYGIALAIKKIAQMSVPLVGARVGGAITSFVSMIMIAKLGHDQLAASALINGVSFSFVTPIWSLFFAVSVLVGHAYGAKKENEIGKVVRQGLWLGIIASVPTAIILWNIAPILILVGQEKNLAFLTQTFFRAYCFGMIPIFWFTCITNFLAGISKQNLSLIFSLTSIPLIIIFGYAFIFGKFGFPAMGIKGAGYASGIAFLIEDCVILFYLYKKKEYKKYDLFTLDFRIDTKCLKHIFHIGWPIAAMTAGELTAFSISTIFIGWINEQQLAAQQITLQINIIAFMVPFGIATAATVLISQEMGRGNTNFIKYLGNAAAILCALTSIIFLALYLTVPKLLIGLYLSAKDSANLQIIAISIPLLAVTGIMNIFDAIRTAASCSLRGMRDTFVPMVIFIILGGLISLPVGYYLAFPLHYGVMGIRWGFVIGFFVGAVILLCRFRKFVTTQLPR